MILYRTAEQVRAEFGAHPRRALIITTVVHEGRAVDAHLVALERIAGANGTIYEVGKFPDPAGDWHVVHVMTQAGNSDTSAVATKAHWEFGKFDVQMFVGVAGSLKQDIPIGSVVVGDYVYNSHSAKIDDDGQYSRPHSHAAAPELLKAAQMLVLHGDWVEFIRNPLLSELPSPEAYPCPFPPEAVIKGIASGEQVVAGGNTPLYKSIRLHMNDVGAIEMEGFGAMSAAHQERTSAIVVRGISDMCDGKSHDTDLHNQPIASAHAAAFAFAILSLRSKASSLSPGVEGLATPSARSSIDAPVSLGRMEFILNFQGLPSDWPGESIDAVVDALRKITGDPELKLVRVEAGSVRLVVSVRRQDVSALSQKSLKAAIGDLAPRLLGAASADDAAWAATLTSALAHASAGLLCWETTLPGGEWLERSERLDIERRFELECSTTVLLGEPGSGKSALLAAMALQLTGRQAALLAIKADLVSTEVRSELDLQADLQLPEPPGDLIERLAGLQPVFLFIDQLDALASHLDLRSERLNVLLNLIRRVGVVPNVHILLSARIFEFNHDVRLRTLNAEAVELALPPWHEVKALLSSDGVDADLWPESAREVIRNPQALKTYLSLANTPGEPPFSKYQSMLEQLWSQKIATAPDSEGLAALASDLAETMAEEEALWLAAARYDNRSILLARLESIGLIVRSQNGKSVAFSHQTVFDYVLARSFVRSSGRLSTYVLERENSLFVRPKLWSALRYLRDAELSAYEREFIRIWRHGDLRWHLRLMLIEFLGEIGSPTPLERTCFQEVMQSDVMRAAGLKAIVGSRDWFENFSGSAIPAAMTADLSLEFHALRILQGGWMFARDEVTRLIEDFWLNNPDRDHLTWSAIEASPQWTEKIETIAATVLSRTAISSWQIDYTASVLAVAQPEIALRLVRKKLEFLVAEAAISRRESPEQAAERFNTESQKPFVEILEGSEWTSLPAIAEAEPVLFLRMLWPWFQAVFGKIKERDDSSHIGSAFPGIHSVNWGLCREKFSSREPPILCALRLAVEGVAKDHWADFLVWVAENSALEHMAPQRLIAHGFYSEPRRYASRALEWVTEDKRRLLLGTLKGLRETTIALISAISPNWSSQECVEFESLVNKYLPQTPPGADPEDRKHLLLTARRIRASLFNAISKEKLSARAAKLVAVERRALGDDLDPGLGYSVGGVVGSPMSSDEMAKAKDRDILRIFSEISDGAGWNHPKHWMQGGNVQLSRAFAEFGKSDPPRALSIITKFEPGLQERAAGYAVDSIAEQKEFHQELQQTIIDLDSRGFKSDEFRSSAASAVDKIARKGSSVSSAIVEVLTSWLRSEPFESDEEMDSSETIETARSGGEQAPRDESILWGYGGISILPSGNFPILSALTSILLERGEEGRDDLIAILNKHLKRERNPKVWQALLSRLSNAGGSTPEIASNFLRALFCRHPGLLETREAIHFFAYAQRWDDLLVFELTAAWSDSHSAILRQAHGELAGLISIVQGSERWVTLRQRMLESGTDEAKLGLAYASVNLWIDPALHCEAGRVLVRLVDGADSVRMAAILDVFRLCDRLVPDATTLLLLESFAAPNIDLSAAPSLFVVEKLQTLLPNGANLVAAIALKLVAAWRTDLSSTATAASMAAPQLTDLALTLHRMGGTTRDAGVSLFEALVDLDAYGARDTLTEIDGRFGVKPSGARRRIARRTKSGVGFGSRR